MWRVLKKNSPHFIRNLSILYNSSLIMLTFEKICDIIYFGFLCPKALKKYKVLMNANQIDDN